MALTTLAVIGAVAAVGSAYSQYKAGVEQKKSIKAQQRKDDIRASRERRMAIRNARVARASVESQAALTGLYGSSAAAGSMSSIQSRLGEMLSFLDQNAALNAQASQANQNAANWASRSNTFQAVGSLAGAASRIYAQPAPTAVGE